MRVYKYDSTHPLSVTSESKVASEAPLQYSGGIDWNTDGEGGHRWVEALLRDSAGDALSYGGVNLDLNRRIVTCRGRRARLSQTDFELFLLLARNKNRMLSYARIYRRLWGSESKVSVRRLRVHVFRLRRRLVEERVGGIQIINRCGLGYVMEIDNQELGRSARLRNYGSGYNARGRAESALDGGRRMSTAAE